MKSRGNSTCLLSFYTFSRMALNSCCSSRSFALNTRDMFGKREACQTVGNVSLIPSQCSLSKRVLMPNCRRALVGIFAIASQNHQSSFSTSQNPIGSSESALILIRHGESLWNQKNLFTGCVDVPLTKEGVEEAIEAGKRISNLPVDIIFTSALIRAQMTAMLAMTQHLRKKVPVILHNEDVRAESWSKIFSKVTEDQTIPVITAWELNERMYGELQGLNKRETAEKFGKQKVLEWRRSYDIPPPNGESLAMCAERSVAYFKKQVEPVLYDGQNVMIAAHGNSLRAIIMYLDKLTSQEVIDLELSTGVPMLYVFKEGKFIRRGSPIGPDTIGVYAFTPDLAVYREQLENTIL
ncbi:hypothetical protein O6H91_02G097400 [Diphasiastrum complanatum]|uniref:Uncharacterized protein n=1 Tax=Diphasiastrum complanatum TaxID=34168 RepID=A0ACC2EIU8_DIPCM|nr:hypothetical protein O6H91_02G097400 [Diphasiastrum complanatum]